MNSFDDGETSSLAGVSHAVHAQISDELRAAAANQVLQLEGRVQDGLFGL